MTYCSIQIEKTIEGRAPMDAAVDHALSVRVIALSSRKAGSYIVSSAGFEKFPIP
jgi:hypothetical protein